MPDSREAQQLAEAINRGLCPRCTWSKKAVGDVAAEISKVSETAVARAWEEAAVIAETAIGFGNSQTAKYIAAALREAARKEK